MRVTHTTFNAVSSLSQERDRFTLQSDQDILATLGRFSIHILPQVRRQVLFAKVNQTTMVMPNGFGTLLIGGLVSAILYGITTLQTYMYYMHDTEDAVIIKLLVAVVWIFDTLHASFTCHILYYYLITNYGNLASLEYVVWSFPASSLMNAVVVLAVQCFFARQIHNLCRPQVKWWVTAPILLFASVQFGFGLGTQIQEIVNPNPSVITQMRYYGVTPGVAVNVLAEVMITASLCILLYEQGSSSAFPRTKRLLNTLIVYAVNRCLLTLPLIIAELVTVVLARDTWFLGLSFVLGKLYANSFLASLNSREHLRHKDTGTLSGVRISTVQFANPAKLSAGVEHSNIGGMQFA